MHPPVNPNVKFTYADYCSMLYDDKRYELIEGELYLTPSPLVIHQVVAQRIESILREYVDRGHLGVVLDAPVDVVLSDINVVQPDILFIRKERTTIITEANISGAPDLVVEILSPSNKERDLKQKMSLYSRFGVREYWIVDPQGRTVQQHVYQSDGLVHHATIPEDGELHAKILPGLSLALTGLFDFNP